MKESVFSFEEKNYTTLVYLLSNCRQVLNIFKTNPLNIMFDDFIIWLLGYRTEFSCLYLPQGHNIRITVWLLSTDENIIIFILSESSYLNKPSSPKTMHWEVVL